jgi:hypothetical protein
MPQSWVRAPDHIPFDGQLDMASSGPSSAWNAFYGALKCTILVRRPPGVRTKIVR